MGARGHGSSARRVALSVDLLPGRSYRFRYVVEGERWENDWAADDYLPNGFGGEDSVVIV